MKNLLIVLSAYVIIMLGSCTPDIEPLSDPNAQAVEDSATIVNYIEDLGLTGQDSVLASGVHYVILDPGDGDTIGESDIVTFDYIGMTLEDTIFSTSTKEIADSIRASAEADKVGKTDTVRQQAIINGFPEDDNYIPLRITYSASGWTLPAGFPFRSPILFFGNGLVNGISGSFRNVRVGGKVLVILPSAQGFGAATTFLVSSNSVIAFELFPTEVEKQE